jgi:hypothetical protein
MTAGLGLPCFARTGLSSRKPQTKDVHANFHRAASKETNMTSQNAIINAPTMAATIVRPGSPIPSKENKENQRVEVKQAISALVT